MLVAQRTRELALLRAIGASRSQVLRLVLGEAVVVDLLGSGLGLGLGLLIAVGGQWIIRR
jgi:putative ABC transport system permease protein